MKCYYYIESAEGNVVCVAESDSEKATQRLKKVFEGNDFWGFDPDKICEMNVNAQIARQFVTAGLLPRDGKYLISQQFRIG